jgi:hypothetical protein
MGALDKAKAAARAARAVGEAINDYAESPGRTLARGVAAAGKKVTDKNTKRVSGGLDSDPITDHKGRVIKDMSGRTRREK